MNGKSAKIAPSALLSSPLIGVTVLLQFFSSAKAAPLDHVTYPGSEKYFESTSQDQLSQISQFSDLQPTDWAYQALSKLIESNGCVAGFSDETYKAKRYLTRYEAAALLNSCLDGISTTTDELKRLLQEFQGEIQTIRSKLDSIASHIDSYEAQKFSATTKFSGVATMAVGGSSYGGYNLNEIQTFLNKRNAPLRKNATLNYNTTWNLNTSYTGKDLLAISLRAGNFGKSTMQGGSVPLNQQSVAYEPDAGADIVALEKFFYRFPLSDNLTFIIGPRVGQSDMLAIKPFVYPQDANLTALTFNGAPGAYNSVKGPGLGFIWKKKNWMASLSAGSKRGYISDSSVRCTSDYLDEEDNYVCTKGNLGGSLFGKSSGDAASLQVGYSNGPFRAAAIWTYSLANVPVSGSTPLAAGSTADLLYGGGFYNSLGLAVSWDPKKGGIIPSINIGAGINFNTYSSSQSDSAGAGKVNLGNSIDASIPQYKNWKSSVTQSWTVGLQWKNAFAKDNFLGFGFGTPNYVVYAKTTDGQTRYFNDKSYMFELWYAFKFSDNITIVPSIYYLSNPYGDVAYTFNNGIGGSGSPFTSLGYVLKTIFKF